MSYDFTGLTDDELEKQLAVVDDRRIWVIAEAVSYTHLLRYSVHMKPDRRLLHLLMRH